MLSNIRNKEIKQDLDDIITYWLLNNTSWDKIKNVIKYIEKLENN